MADSPLPDADPADVLEQQQPADDASAPVDRHREHSVADPVPEADAIEQSQPVPDPEGNAPDSLDPD